MNVQAVSLGAYEGTLVLLEGQLDNGERVAFVVDHRMARSILEELDAGDDPVCEIEPYQIIYRDLGGAA